MEVLYSSEKRGKDDMGVQGMQWEILKAIEKYFGFSYILFS